jgi:hypothetical protein
LTFVAVSSLNAGHPAVRSQRAAQNAGAKAFHVQTYGEDVSYLSRPYPEQSRQMIVDRILQHLTDEQRRATHAWLESVQLFDCFGAPGTPSTH